MQYVLKDPLRHYFSKPYDLVAIGSRRLGNLCYIFYRPGETSFDFNSGLHNKHFGST